MLETRDAGYERAQGHHREAGDKEPFSIKILVSICMGRGSAAEKRYFQEGVAGKPLQEQYLACSPCCGVLSCKSQDFSYRLWPSLVQEFLWKPPSRKTARGPCPLTKDRKGPMQSGKENTVGTKSTADPENCSSN